MCLTVFESVLFASVKFLHHMFETIDKETFYLSNVKKYSESMFYFKLRAKGVLQMSYWFFLAMKSWIIVLHCKKTIFQKPKIW